MTARGVGALVITLLFMLIAGFLSVESVLAVVAGYYSFAVVLWVLGWAYSVFAARFCLLALDEWLTRQENHGESR